MVDKAGQKLAVIETKPLAPVEPLAPVKVGGVSAANDNASFTSSFSLAGPLLSIQVPDPKNPKRINFQIFGLKIPIDLEARPNLSDPTQDSKHAGDDKWIQALLDEAVKKNQEADGLQKRSHDLWRSRGNAVIDWQEEFEFNQQKILHPELSDLSESALLNSENDEAHKSDSLWYSGLGQLAEQRRKEALSLVARAKAMVHEQDIQGNVGLYPLWKSADRLEDTIKKDSSPINDPKNDADHAGDEQWIESLFWHAEYFRKEGDFEEALQYLERVQRVTADGASQLPPVWNGVYMDGPLPKGADPAHLMQLFDKATDLQGEIHRDWHGLSDKIALLEEERGIEKDPAKLQAINQEVEWLKKGVKELAGLDAIQVNSLPAEYKANTRKALVEAYLNHDEAAVRKLTQKELEDLTNVEMVGNDVAGYQLKIEKEGETPVFINVVSWESKMAEATLKGVEGKVVVTTVQTDQGPIEIRQFVGVDGSIAFQKITEDFGDIETLRKVAEAEPAQKFLFDQTNNKFPDYFAYTGLTFNFSAYNQAICDQQIFQRLGFVPNPSPFEMHFSKAADLPLPKEFFRLNYEEGSYEEVTQEGGWYLKIDRSEKEPEQWKILEKISEKEERSKLNEREGSEKTVTYRTDQGVVEIHTFMADDENVFIWKKEVGKLEAIERARGFIFPSNTITAHVNSVRTPPYSFQTPMQNLFYYPIDPATGLAGVRKNMKQVRADLSVYNQFLQDSEKSEKEEKMKEAKAEALAYTWQKERTGQILSSFNHVEQKIAQIQKTGGEGMDLDETKKDLKTLIGAMKERNKKDWESKKAQYLATHPTLKNILKTDEDWKKAFELGGPWNLIDPQNEEQSKLEMNYIDDHEGYPVSVSLGELNRLHAEGVLTGYPLAYEWDNFSAEEFHYQEAQKPLTALLEKAEQMDHPEKALALYQEVQTLQTQEMDQGLDQLYNHAVQVLQGPGMGADSDKINKFGEDLFEIQKETDPRKKAEKIQRWREEMDFYTWKLAMKGERKIAENLRDSGELWGDIKGYARFLGHYAGYLLPTSWIWGSPIDEKDYQAELRATFNPYIDKLDSALTQFEAGEKLMEEAYAAKDAGNEALYLKLRKNALTLLQNSWNDYGTLNRSVQREIIVEVGQDSATYSGIVIGIGCIALAALTAGYATPLLVGAEATLLTTTAVSAGIFTLTYETASSGVYSLIYDDQQFIWDPDRWDSPGDVAGSLFHLGGAYVENFAMFYFMAATFGRLFQAGVSKAMSGSAEKIAIEAGLKSGAPEMIKVGGELVPLTKGNFNLLSKEAKAFYLNEAMEAGGKGARFFRKAKIWAAGEVNNYIALNTWTLLSSTVKGEPVDLLSWKTQSHVLMFLGGLAPINLASGKLVKWGHKSYYEKLQKEYGEKFAKEFKGLNNELEGLSLEQLKLTRDGYLELARMNEGDLRLQFTEKAKKCDSLIKWFQTERVGFEKENAQSENEASGLIQGLAVNLSTNPELLLHPEWAQWMENNARLQVKMADHAQKRMEFMEENPGSFTKLEQEAQNKSDPQAVGPDRQLPGEVKNDPAPAKKGFVIDAKQRNYAKMLAMETQQAKPYYERWARMLSAHRKVFGENAGFDPINNLKKDPYNARKGTALIDTLPDLLGADANHPVFVKVNPNGVIDVVLLGIDAKGVVSQESFSITPNKRMSHDEVSALQRHVKRAIEKNPNMKRFNGTANDIVINVGENGQAYTRPEVYLSDPNPAPARPPIDVDYTPPPSQTPSPSADPYTNFQVAPDLANGDFVQ